MKRTLSRSLALLLIMGILLGIQPGAVFAGAQKTETRRAIAIVFDNSGSMYNKGEKAWSRATYAMEVFAEMLNENDVLSVYPMHPITVDGSEYSQDAPLVINGPADAPKIRRIYTENPLGTPIETITKAHDGLNSTSGFDEKWLIVLTDGDTFNGYKDSTETAKALKERLEPYSKDMNVLYLGIGEKAAEPACSSKGEYKLEVKIVKDSDGTLLALTEMCNSIFGRDTLPKTHFNNGRMNIDVSMNKMIVFVQGANIGDVKVTDKEGKEPNHNAPYTMKYPENGVNPANVKGEVKTDTDLQGVMITYTNCGQSDYTLSYSGTASRAEVYYEPNVEMEFTFTDEDGNNVDPDNLYEGFYKIGFGLKDGITGKYTTSPLLGNPKYTGNYDVSGSKTDINFTGMHGEVKDVPLKVGDTFTAEMTVEYLSGYKITKTADELFPSGGKLEVVPKPSGELRLEITGGQAEYQLKKLEEGEPFTAVVYYQDQKLTGADLENTELTWPDKSGAELKEIFRDDHYDIILQYKDPSDPQSTPTGEFTVPITARFTPQASTEATSNAVNISYSITDSNIAVDVKLSAPQTYYVIGKIENGKPIRADLLLNGEKVSPEQFAEIDFSADCSGIPYDLEALPGESAYLIHLKKPESLGTGNYKISCRAEAKDELGRPASGEDSLSISLNAVEKWVKLAIAGFALALLLILLTAILRAKALPTKLNTRKKECTLIVDDEDVSKNASFDAHLAKRRLDVTSKFAGKKLGITMDVKPGKDSRVMTPQVKRVADVTSSSVKKQGNYTINEATIGSVRYVFDESTRKFERMPKSDKPISLKNGANITYSGTFQSNGEPKSFAVRSRLNFKKK